MNRLILFAVIILLLAQCGNNETQNTKNISNNSSVTEPDNSKNNNKQKKDISFKVISEKIVEAGEIFQVKYEMNVEPDNFSPPDFKNIDVISGPAVSSFSSIQIINGKRSQKITNSYTYRVSCPKPGKYTVKPAEIIVDGQNYKSDSLIIKVTGEEKSNNNSIAKKINSTDDIFITTEYSKTSVYNGEYITVTTKLHTKTDFQNISEIKFPDYSGFWTKPLQEPRQLKFHNELINGKKYSTALLKQTLLFAVKPGKYTISPYVISLQIKKKDGKVRDFFGNIVNNYKLVNKRLETKPQTIIVKPLPEPVPENFSGLTGKNISIAAETDTQNFSADESAYLKITISGTGNLYLLNDLKLKLPEELKHFKPEIELKDKYTEYGETGDKIFNFIITAEKPGNYTIPPVNFVYFDSETQNYKTVSTKEIKINVTKGKGYTTNTEDKNTLINKDIRYIKTNTERLNKNDSNLVGSLWFYLLYPALLLILILIMYIRKKQEKANADIKTVKKKKAGKISQKRLKNALKHMKDNNKDAFYKEIISSLWGYLSDKLSVNAEELTNESINKILADRKINKELISKLLNTIEICRYAQYSPASEETAPEIIYKNSEEVINELEKVL